MNLGSIRISTKILAVIGLLGLVSAGITVTGISALKAVDSAADEMSLAGKEAVLGGRMRQNVLALNRGEYRIAADPTTQNIEEAVKFIDLQRKEFEERLAAAVATADEEQAKLLSDVRAAYEKYVANLASTIKTAQRVAGQVEITGAQKEVLAETISSRADATLVEDATKAYVEFTQQKSDRFDQLAQETYDSAEMTMIVGAVGGILVGLILGLIISQKGIVRPMRRIVECLRSLADGRLETDVFGIDRKDEVGDISKTTLVFKESMVRARKLEAEQKEAEKRAVEEKKQMMAKLAGDFEASVGAIVNTVSSAANEMQTTAGSLSATAEQTSRQSSSVAAASEQATTNVQTVASAAEELSSSVAEISRQVAQSSSIAAKAVSESERTNALVKGLAEAAQKIGAVTALINEIASQTNLLALNATIEAARAGEAGKGFAVVASEVKSLANQTAKATDEISAQIAAMQNATGDTVTAIQSIGATITQINEIATTIASAVEEQGAATQEIARNVQQAAAGTKEVSGNIVGVTQAAGETGAAATQMLGAAGELSKQSEELRAQVDKFLIAVRAA